MTIRLAVAGCGGHSMQSHIVPGIPLGFVVSAVFDPSDQNITTLRRQTDFDPQVFTNFEEMVNQPDIDAVLITSPDKYHPQQLLSTVNAGKPVLCDKPLASTSEDLRVVVEALTRARSLGQVVHSCHPRHETPDQPYGWVKANLEELVSHFGSLVHIELDFSYHAPVKSWKMQRSLLIDHFSHEIDFVLWILGDVSFEAWRLADSYDRYCVAGRASGDVSFLFTGTRRLASKTYPETITLRFDRGTCVANTKTGVITYRNHETEELVVSTVSSTNYDARSQIIMSGFAAAIGTSPDPALSDRLWQVNASAVMLFEEGHYRS